MIALEVNLQSGMIATGETYGLLKTIKLILVSYSRHWKMQFTDN